MKFYINAKYRCVARTVSITLRPSTVFLIQFSKTMVCKIHLRHNRIRHAVCSRGLVVTDSHFRARVLIWFSFHLSGLRCFRHFNFSVSSACSFQPRGQCSLCQGCTVRKSDPGDCRWGCASWRFHELYTRRWSQLLLL